MYEPKPLSLIPHREYRRLIEYEIVTFMKHVDFVDQICESKYEKIRIESMDEFYIYFSADMKYGKSDCFKVLWPRLLAEKCICLSKN